MAVLALLLTAIAFTAVFAESTVSSKWVGYGHDKIGSPTGRYWVFFDNKPSRFGSADQISEQGLSNLSERSLQRRLNRIKGNAYDALLDLPVSTDYVDSIRKTEAVIHRTSRLLNAVSINASQKQLTEIGEFDFVTEIRPVLSYSRGKPVADYEPPQIPFPKIGEWQLDYGESFGQLLQINVPYLHDEGLSGEDIIIGVFDTGFRLTHPATSGIDVLATYDFINDDEDVDDDDNLQVDHGTSVVSVIGSAVDGWLYGPAYGSTFVLAKTEDERGETQVEEDNFVAALEWADSIGCDVVTASLGYSDWYTFEDLDGNTAVTSIACDAAVALGITVVSSAGNERVSPWGHITAPADGDSVIAVGAVTPSGSITYFSSPGPTSDGQIKPDICTRGSGVTAATYYNQGYENTFSGTSAAAPLAAGAIALLLELHPEWSPIDVRDALWATGQRRSGISYPNNDYGYGIIDAAAASGLFGEPTSDRSVLAYPNPFESSIKLKFPVEAASGHIYIFALDGSIVFERALRSGPPVYEFEWDGRNNSGNEVASGLYLVKVTGVGFEGIVKIAKIR